jgi:propanol-preferring alcohol dehydrogenase
VTSRVIPSNSLPAETSLVNKPYQIKTGPTPKPSSLQPHEVLVKIATASFCHTDSMISSGVFHSPLPQTASHEGAGTVVAIGPAVEDFRPGNRVMCGLTTQRCGRCVSRQGPEEFRYYCTNQGRVLGIPRDGAFAEYLVVDTKESNRLPDKVSFETAAPLA